MAGTITGGTYKGQSFSCMYFNQDKYNDISTDQRFYVCDGLIGAPEEKRPAVLVFGVESDQLVYACEVHNGEFDAKDIMENINAEISKMTRSDMTLINKLSHAEKCNIEDAVSDALRNHHDKAYTSGLRSFDNDYKELMAGTLGGLRKEKINWINALNSECQLLDMDDIRRMQLREMLFDAAKDVCSVDEERLDVIIECTITQNFDALKERCDMDTLEAFLEKEYQNHTFEEQEYDERD